MFPSLGALVFLLSIAKILFHLLIHFLWKEKANNETSVTTSWSGTFTKQSWHFHKSNATMENLWSWIQCWAGEHKNENKRNSREKFGNERKFLFLLIRAENSFSEKSIYATGIVKNSLNRFQSKWNLWKQFCSYVTQQAIKSLSALSLDGFLMEQSIKDFRQ